MRIQAHPVIFISNGKAFTAGRPAFKDAKIFHICDSGVRIQGEIAPQWSTKLFRSRVLIPDSDLAQVDLFIFGLMIEIRVKLFNQGMFALVVFTVVESHDQ